MSETRVLFTEDLDDVRCAHPECDHTSHDDSIFLHARCHPLAGTWAEYRAGVLTILCRLCRRTVASVAIARRGDEP